MIGSITNNVDNERTLWEEEIRNACSMLSILQRRESIANLTSSASPREKRPSNVPASLSKTLSKHS